MDTDLLTPVGLSTPVGTPAPVARPVPVDGGPWGAGTTPIDVLLGRQQELTPVERFARIHEADLVPAGERWWADRLPTARPSEGEQYAFAVDLDACTGCKACVSACNNLNGLDDDEHWRSVATVHGQVPDGPSVLTVTAACHHCADPACLSGCPVDAYEKDPFTGIVAHLDDQCIGCSYCTLTCPYEVPQYNASLGIVRKCDLCRGRLAEGEAPACVQGCPNGAIAITVVDVDAVRAELAADPDLRLVPGAPDSRLTVPTTRYRSTRVASGTFADHRVVTPGHAHTPLAVMLALTQVAVGTAVVAATLGLVSPDAVPGAVPVTALGVALVALAASVGHLGRPLQAWRAVIGIRHSWLSREIVAFGAFAGLGVAHALASVLDLEAGLVTGLQVAAAVAGVGGVACSVLLYAVTGRTWWRVRTSATRFAVTGVAGGALLVATMALAWPRSGASVDVARSLLGLAAVVSTWGLVAQVLVFRGTGPGGRRPTDLGATRALLTGPLLSLLRARLAAALLGGVLVPLEVLAALAGAAEGAPAHPAAVVVCGLAWVVFLVGELTDRRLFFLGSVAPRQYGDHR